MNRGFDDFLTDLSGVADDEGLRSIVGGYLAENGFEGFMFSVFLEADMYTMCRRGPEHDLLLRYRRDGYDLIDPVSRQARSSWLPVIWDACQLLGVCTGEQARLFEVTLEHGFERGISVPLRGPLGSYDSFVALTRQSAGDFDAVKHEWCRKLMLIGTYMSSVYHGVLHPDGDCRTDLTRRELECLQWTAHGKTAWEVSRLLDVSERTVQFHIQNACRKLDAVSKHQATLKAASRGLIRP